LYGKTRGTRLSVLDYIQGKLKGFRHDVPYAISGFDA
jgi:hypothetical protein